MVVKTLRALVAGSLVGALGAWHNGRSYSVRHSYADRFGAMAALLTRAREVVQLVSDQVVKS